MTDPHRKFDLYRDKPLPNVLTTSETPQPSQPTQPTKESSIDFSEITFEELRQKFLDLAYAKFNSDSALHVATKLHDQLLIKIDNMKEIELNLLTQIEFYQKRVRHLEEVIAKEFN